MTEIHPTAIVENGAEIGENVTVGPYCIIGPEVVLGDGVILISHVVMNGRTDIGGKTRVFPFASIGTPPQDLKYRGEPSRLVVGWNTVIREHVTMNPGTEGGGMLTQVATTVCSWRGVTWPMTAGSGTTSSWSTTRTLGGHVRIGDWAILGGLSAVHQFVRIGRHAMVGGMSGVEHDVIPYGSVVGNRARLSGLNVVGLKRRDFSRDTIHALRNAYRLLFAAEGTMTERLDDVAELFRDNEPVMEIVDFIRADSSRAVCQPGLEDAA